MTEKVPKPTKPEETPEKIEQPVDESFEAELQQLTDKFEADVKRIEEKMAAVTSHHEAQIKAIDSLTLLKKEFIEEFYDVLQRMAAQRIEIMDLEASDQEVEAEFQKNPKVNIDLRAAGLQSLLDSNVDENKIKEELIHQAFLQLNVRAVFNRPENIEFQQKMDEVSDRLSSNLSSLFGEADFGKPDDPVDIVEQEVARLAVVARGMLNNSLRDLRSLFYNR